MTFNAILVERLLSLMYKSLHLSDTLSWSDELATVQRVPSPNCLSPESYVEFL